MNKNKKSIKLKVQLFLNRLRYNIQIEKDGKLFKIILPERYKNIIKILKYSIIILSLFSSLFTFQSIFVSLVVAIFFYFITTLFEKIIFFYSGLYIPALPDFEIKPEKWLGTQFGIGKIQGKENYDVPIVGPVLSDIKYAKKIHSLIFSWTEETYKDSDKNVSMSAIYEDDNYFFFIYPNLEKKRIEQFHSKLKEEVNKKDPNGVTSLKFMFQVIGRRCNITKRSLFPYFKSKYENGIPILFRFYIKLENSNKTKKIDDLKDFVIYDFKIKNRQELTRKDLEYDLIKLLSWLY